MLELLRTSFVVDERPFAGTRDRFVVINGAFVMIEGRLGAKNGPLGLVIRGVRYSLVQLAD